MAKRALERSRCSVGSIESQRGEALGNEESRLRRIAPNGLVEEPECLLIVALPGGLDGTLEQSPGINPPKGTTFRVKRQDDNRERRSHQSGALAVPAPGAIR